MKKKPSSERVVRELSSDEQQLVTRAREETEANRDQILAEGRLRKRALELSRGQVHRTLATLKAKRESLGMSLVDVQQKSGLKPSAISRLENDPDANPTLLTLQRYASAVGMMVVTEVESMTATQ